MIAILNENYSMRPATFADATTLANLINAVAQRKFGQAITSEQKIRLLWEMPSVNLKTDVHVVVTSNGEIAGFTELLNIPPHAYLIASGWVHPFDRNKGIGTYLLHHTESHAKQAISKINFDKTVTLNYEVYPNNTRFQRLLKKEGYNLVRKRWRMEITLSNLPDMPQLPKHIGIKPFAFTEANKHDIYDVMHDTFGDKWGYPLWAFDDWWHFYSQGNSIDPTLWLMALHGTDVVGIALNWGNLHGKMSQHGYIAYMGVRHAYRRHGIANSLIYHTFRNFYQSGKHNITLHVDSQSLTNAQQLYEKTGMKVVGETWIFQKELC
ncbi:MAG: hypothetical protein B6242_14885 [Anaerolineaceae bacterium 4572_78]|nr:MAG: hypothetical protein B6242_14885 [Anaerolineaceae bacterium 4572_78]